MSEEPRPSEPAHGAMWFPDEGRIMFRGQAYLPDDYVFSRRDMRDAWHEGYDTGGNDVGSGLRENELSPNPYQEDE